MGTLFSIPASSDRAYYSFLIIFLVTAIAGTVLLALWRYTHKSVRGLLEEIKSQMPPNPEARKEAEPEAPSPVTS